jgi:hypothetical protein
MPAHMRDSLPAEASRLAGAKTLKAAELGHYITVTHSAKITAPGYGSLRRIMGTAGFEPATSRV